MPKQTIPYVDMKDKTRIDLLRAYPDAARKLVRASSRSFGLASRLASLPLLPLADRLARKWLEQSGNPYRHEIETFADITGAAGTCALNLSYEWGCTSGVWRTDETITMLRVLDWPFPDLGQHVMVLRHHAKAGDYYDISWPAISGVYTAMAPGRFSVALNLAPMRRHGRGIVGDWMSNRWLMRREQALPPPHLLRQVCERAANYQEAREMLMNTPIAVPAIFTIGGIGYSEGAVIERLEYAKEELALGGGQQVRAANHFNSVLNTVGYGWRAREIDSAGRYRASGTIGERELRTDHFGWLQAPIINARTRLIVLSDAATGRLMVQGYAGNLAVTNLFTLRRGDGATPAESMPDMEYA